MYYYLKIRKCYIMLITESQLRNIIKKEILNESIKQKILATLIAVVAPMLMSGPLTKSQISSDRVKAEIMEYVMKQCEKKKIDITNPDHADKVRVEILEATRLAVEEAGLNHNNRFAPRDNLDATTIFKR